MVITEQTTQTLPAPNTTLAAVLVILVVRLGKEQDVSLPLVVPLSVEMSNVLRQDSAER